jgi:hypothetical protein
MMTPSKPFNHPDHGPGAVLRTAESTMLTSLY